MTEAFIAHACSAFNNAWSSGNSLVVDCQPLTDALRSLSLTVATLQQDVHQLREQNEQYRSQHLAGQVENSTLKSQVGELSSAVKSLLDAATGMICRPEFEQRLESCVRENDAKVKDLSEAATTRFSVVTRTADDDRQRVMNLAESVDGLRQTSLEGMHALRSQILQTENQMRGLNAERCQAHLQLTSKHDDHTATTASRIASVREDLLEKMEKNKQHAADSLAKNVDELLQHLDRQAQRVDALQRVCASRDANIPTKHEVEKLSKALDDSRHAVDESQIRLQETFAQCMSLLETSAFSQHQQQQQQQLHDQVHQQQFHVQYQQQHPHQHQHHHHRHPHSLSSSASAAAASVVTSGGSSSLNAMNASNVSPAVATSFASMFETRLDQVQKLVERILQEELPWLASEAKAKHEDHIVLVQAQKRAESMLVALCDVCGLGTAETLAAALRMNTVAKAQSIIQGGLKKLLSPSVIEELISYPQVINAIKTGLSEVFVTNTGLVGALQQQKQQWQAPTGNQENSASTAQQLLKAPAVAAANQRYEQSLRARDGVAAANHLEGKKLGGISVGSNETLRLGVDIADVTISVASSSSLSVGIPKTGVQIMAVARGGVAEKSGLLRGDIVLEIDGSDVKGCEQFMTLIQNLDRRFKTECRSKNIYPFCGNVDTSVLRNDITMHVTLKLEWSSHK